MSKKTKKALEELKAADIALLWRIIDCERVLQEYERLFKQLGRLRLAESDFEEGNR